MCWSNGSALLSVVFLDGGRLKILYGLVLELVSSVLHSLSADFIMPRERGCCAE